MSQITWSPGPGISSVVIPGVGTVYRCPRCPNWYLGAGNLCKSCQAQRQAMAPAQAVSEEYAFRPISQLVSSAPALIIGWREHGFWQTKSTGKVVALDIRPSPNNPMVQVLWWDFPGAGQWDLVKNQGANVRPTTREGDLVTWQTAIAKIRTTL